MNVLADLIYPDNFNIQYKLVSPVLQYARLHFCIRLCYFHGVPAPIRCRHFHDVGGGATDAGQTSGTTPEVF